MLNHHRGRSLAARMPRERVLTESDGPFAQVNGETVMPWHVEKAIHELSRIWSLAPLEVEQTIQLNLQGLLAHHQP
jgi:TatD DNase family protein